MAITPLPTLNRTSAAFRTDVDTFFGLQLPAFVAEANALEANVNAKEVTASAAAVTATTQAGIATTGANTATTKAGEAVTSALNADAARVLAQSAAASITAQVAVATNSATSKTTPIDADEIPITDSAASFGLKKLTWLNLKATLKTYLDGIYAGKGANGDITSLSAITSINGGQIAGMRNKLRNGDFSINQMAVSGTVTLAAGAYGHDMWKAGAAGCTYTFVTVQNITTITITAGSLIQVIEGIYLQSGTYCLSWGGTAQGKIGAGAFSNTGITGTAVGGTNLNVEFGTGTLSFVQLEWGTKPSYFEFRLNELQLCQVYYWQYTGTLALAVSMAGGYFTAQIPLPVTMRASPVASTNLVDGQYTGVAPSTGSQWSLVTPGAGYSAKTGTATIALIAASGNSALTLQCTGATFGNSTQLVSASGVAITAAARL